MPTTPRHQLTKLQPGLGFTTRRSLELLPVAPIRLTCTMEALLASLAGGSNRDDELRSFKPSMKQVVERLEESIEKITKPTGEPTVEDEDEKTTTDESANGFDVSGNLTDLAPKYVEIAVAPDESSTEAALTASGEVNMQPNDDDIGVAQANPSVKAQVVEGPSSIIVVKMPTKEPVELATTLDDATAVDDADGNLLVSDTNKVAANADVGDIGAVQAARAADSPVAAEQTPCSYGMDTAAGEPEEIDICTVESSGSPVSAIASAVIAKSNNQEASNAQPVHARAAESSAVVKSSATGIEVVAVKQGTPGSPEMALQVSPELMKKDFASPSDYTSSTTPRPKKRTARSPSAGRSGKTIRPIGTLKSAQASGGKSIVEDFPNEPLGGGRAWSPGWIRRIVPRGNGATRKSDKFWFTPVKKLKLRSIKQVEIFMDLISEFDGDEEMTLEAMGGTI
jgi:hypothetical protein